MTSAAQGKRAARPRDRKEQIQRAAARLFNINGYHAVRMEHVAAEVGVAPSALYRHFPNKQALLTSAAMRGLTRVCDVMDDADQSSLPPADTLDLFLAALSEAAVDQHGSAALWKREAREMLPADREVIRFSLRRMVVQLAGLLRRARPDLGESDAELLARSVFAVSTSLSQWIPPLPPARLKSMLKQMTTAVVALRFPLTTADAPPSMFEPLGSRPADQANWYASRREALLAAAAELFLHRGYASVSMDDLSAATGIAAPNIYRYFPGKADILSTLLMRSSSLLSIDAGRAVRNAAAPPDILVHLLKGYARNALEHTELIALALSEGFHLADLHAEQFNEAREERFAQWRQAIAVHRPALGEAEIQVLTLAAMTLINDASRVRRLRQRPHLAEELAVMCLRLIQAGPG